MNDVTSRHSRATSDNTLRHSQALNDDRGGVVLSGCFQRVQQVNQIRDVAWQISRPVSVVKNLHTTTTALQHTIATIILTLSCCGGFKAQRDGGGVLFSCTKMVSFVPDKVPTKGWSELTFDCTAMLNAVRLSLRTFEAFSLMT